MNRLALKMKTKILPRLSLCFVSTFLSLVILEWILRIISPPTIFSPLLPLRPHLKMELHVDLRGVSPKGMHTTNKWGFRGDEPPSEWEKYYTLVAVGGSTTQCFYLDDHKTWPYRLQEELKKQRPHIWVGNGGLDGQSTRAHLVFMKEVIPKIKPDAVLILIGGNDLGFSISHDKMQDGIPFDKTSLKYKIFGWSRLVQILYTWKLILFDDVTVVKKGGHGTYQPRELTEEEMPLPKDLKTLLYSLEEYRRNIREMIRLGRSMKVRMVFMTQPMLFEDTPYWKKIEGEFYWVKKTRGTLSAATYWRLLDIYNRELKDISKVEKVECFDAASVIPHSEPYFYDPLHLTERGADRLARQLAKFLKGTVSE